MQGSPRHAPDWQHWPGRPEGDDGVRKRLRALFVPSDAGDAIAELIEEHSRELETRAEELRLAVADLEQREARARELHARIEQVLREGSAELDMRHSDLVVRAAELDRRETAVVEAESRVEDRARELGAVELKSAAVERREQALLEREQALARQERELREQEQALERRASALADTTGLAGDAPDGTEDASHIALAIDNGYRLIEREGAAPAPGEAVELDGSLHRCVRVTASPYPGDLRRCAVLERVPAPEDG
jgi:chromosome condensin MukBEF ATPase and DNA-binding subunit MukB